jgi:hypothetical protein
VLGFEPEHTTASAFDDLRRVLGPGVISSERVAAVEDLVAQAMGVGRG